MNRVNPTSIPDSASSGARTAGSLDLTREDCETIFAALEQRENNLAELGVLHFYPDVTRLRRMFEGDPQPPGREPGRRG